MRVIEDERYNAAMNRRWRLKTRFVNWFWSFFQSEGRGGGGGAKGTELVLLIDSNEMEGDGGLDSEVGLMFPEGSCWLPASPGD